MHQWLRTARITPELVWFLASPGRRADPYPAYRRLQRLDAIHRSPLGVFVVSGHAPVSAALRDPSLSSDLAHLDPSTIHIGPLMRLLGNGERMEHGAFFDIVPQLMLFRDPPDHTRLRSQVSRAFTARTVERLSERISQIAHSMLDEIVPHGSTEFMANFAYPFPARVICELIGVPAEESHVIIEHAPALAGGLDPGPLLTVAARDAANAAADKIVAYLRELIGQRRGEPRADLLSELIALDGGTGLSEDDLIATVLLLLIAGHETTANLLGNGLVALLAQPVALDALRRDPSLDAAAVDELLRFDSPVQMTMRIAATSTEIGGHRVPQGTIVILCTGAANRDAAVFSEPDRLLWDRQPNPHVTFGGGIHYCLGAALARTEAAIALRAVFERMPELALVRKPARRASFTVRALESLELRWS